MDFNKLKFENILKISLFCLIIIYLKIYKIN